MRTDPSIIGQEFVEGRTGVVEVVTQAIGDRWETAVRQASGRAGVNPLALPYYDESDAILGHAEMVIELQRFLAAG